MASKKHKTKSVNSDISTRSGRIITGQRVGGGNRRDVEVAGAREASNDVRLSWQQLAAKREPFAWKAFRRAIRPTVTSFMYQYEWLWFLNGWKARVRNMPLKDVVRQMRFWGDTRV